jgi:hypothetical protein
MVGRYTQSFVVILSKMATVKIKLPPLPTVLPIVLPTVRPTVLPAIPPTVPAPVQALSPVAVTASYTLPAGRYFLGDICYIMKDSVYNYWVDKKHGADGVYTTSSSGSFVVVSADGDGVYPVTLNSLGVIRETQFCTDANNFGLVPTTLMDEEKEKVYNAHVGTADFVMGLKFIFKNPVKYIVKTDSHVITDGDVTITIHVEEPEVSP